MSKEQLYTPEGYQKLVDEREYLAKTRREEVKNEVAVARSFGDLSENSEYDEARNEQAKVEARIKELESLLENAEIIDEANMDAGVISLGSTAKVYDVEWDEEISYEIVGSNEADALNHRISDQSPIGRALMGKRAGDNVEVQAPNGTLHFKVLHVERTK
jgi:transcription elongation factor GreA